MGRGSSHPRGVGVRADRRAFVVHTAVEPGYAAGMTERNGDMSVSGPRRVTVEDASRVLGLSESAIRKRIERNTLRSVRENGARYVLLEDVMTRHDTDTTGHVNDTTADMSTSSSAVIGAKDETIAELRDRVAQLSKIVTTRDEELRRKDHLLAAALERIPALEAPQDAPGATETTTVAPDRGEEEPHPTTEGAEEGAQQRSWLYRFFFGP